MTLLEKRVFIISLITFSLLMIPLIGMQFTSEINWSIFDFVIAGFLLFGTGLLFEFIICKTKKVHIRFALILVVAIIFMLI